jgi:nitroimidazol reductase NimA-like FMN-containing flavoprotein (pyridoxamine 5'-phosphate oxidase superfamily)
MINPSTAGRRDSDDSLERGFEALGRQECLDLLGSHHVGRIAWQAADRPQILPVTYAMSQGSAYFRTAPDSILAELAQPTSVALEVDELDQQTRSGWSIVLHGRTSAVSEPEALADLWGLDSLVPWAVGNRTLFIRIVPERVSGRIVRRPT